MLGHAHSRVKMKRRGSAARPGATVQPDAFQHQTTDLAHSRNQTDGMKRADPPPRPGAFKRRQSDGAGRQLGVLQHRVLQREVVVEGGEVVVDVPQQQHVGDGGDAGLHGGHVRRQDEGDVAQEVRESRIRRRRRRRRRRGRSHTLAGGRIRHRSIWKRRLPGDKSFQVTGQTQVLQNERTGRWCCQAIRTR